ncbi:WbqC family protein [Stappia taiwanensis]|uniref:WbqC family protein n=1 Tax=Stappia taiwanensis TaxID=992267 RepID=A0A838XSD2_9HYPH|nr:WbqC family protein [Stappia taiwanensis]MBA4612657.1 WbqC family protein [Stappia taiwanensis]GGE88699.1 hypothetical protein GCM10007285_15240 [Stappia taiwanensis]
MTRVVISQPMYLPWAGFLAQMALADVYIWLDDAQFSKGSFTNRVQVKTDAGMKWLSIALEGKGSHRAIHDLAPAKADWHQAHRALLLQALRDRPHAKAVLDLFDGLPFDAALVETLIASAEAPAAKLDVLPARRLRSSKMGVDGRSWDRVLRLVQAVGGTEYITGHGALSYLDHETFEAAGIAVSYMDYAPRPWPQSPAPFTPYVTCLDLLASLPAEEAATHLCPATLGWRQFKDRKETGL